MHPPTLRIIPLLPRLASRTIRQPPVCRRFALSAPTQQASPLTPTLTRRSVSSNHAPITPPPRPSRPTTKPPPPPICPSPTPHTAHLASMSPAPPLYEAVIVGAGPAGVTVLGNLLERKLAPILWVDPEFNGGRVSKYYREVPSNTNVDKFVSFAEGVTPFRRIVRGTPARDRWDVPSESDGVVPGGREDKLGVLRGLRQDRGCKLGLAADMIVMLTEGLRRTAGVRSVVGRVGEAVRSEEGGGWRVLVNGQKGEEVVEAKRVVLCHGSSPTEGPLPVDGMENLNLDVALSPTKLSAIMDGRGPTTVSVIGASHSAILVLRNLYNLASSTKPDLKVRWFTRHALRYAEFMDGWILRDNTGLKGEVADWAKAHLEPEVFPKSDVSKYIEAVNYEKGEEEKVFKEHLPGSDLVVQAIGYTRNQLPSLKTAAGQPIAPQFNHEDGSFGYAQQPGQDLARLPGLYGAGIAWPQRVVDPYGNVEHAVGFFKFMKFVKQASPEWN